MVGKWDSYNRPVCATSRERGCCWVEGRGDLLKLCVTEKRDYKFLVVINYRSRSEIISNYKIKSMNICVEILIDLSGSMGSMEGHKENKKYLLDDGKTRIQLVKRLLKNEVIPSLSSIDEIVFRTFRREGEGFTDDKIVKIYSGRFLPEEMIDVVENIKDPKLGGTPITAAISMSINKLNDRIGADRKIILITDGEENGKGDYLESAKALIDMDGKPTNIYIIGICQESIPMEKAKQLASITKGMYINISSSDYNKGLVRHIMSPFKAAIISNSISKLVEDERVQETEKIQTKLAITNAINERSIGSTAPLVPKLERTNSVAEEKGIVEETKIKPQPTKPNEDVVEKVDINQKIEPNLKDQPDGKILESISKNADSILLMSSQMNNILGEISELRKSLISHEEDEVIILGNDQINKENGRKAEEIAFNILRTKYGDRLTWLNQESESFLDHDFEVNDSDGVEFYIECKGSTTEENYFLMTSSEWSLFLLNERKYKLVIVKNLHIDPTLVIIDDLFEQIKSGKILPYSSKNRKIKSDRIQFQVK